MKLPQVSLRELFLLVVIAAMGCGWWVDRSSLHRKNSSLSTTVKQQAGELERWQHSALIVSDYLRTQGWDVVWGSSGPTIHTNAHYKPGPGDAGAKGWPRARP